MEIQTPLTQLDSDLKQKNRFNRPEDLDRKETVGQARETAHVDPFNCSEPESGEQRTGPKQPNGRALEFFRVVGQFSLLPLL